VEPDVTNLESKLEILGTVAEQYPEDSPEQSALAAAAHALMFVQHVETVAKFQRWVSEFTQPPTALQVLHCKLAGVDCPHELLDESTREVEALMERLRHKRA
jgi:hypothetical protein